MIVSLNVTKSSETVRNRDFGSVSVMFRVTATQENRRPDKNAYRCVRLFDELSHVVSSDFSHDHGNIRLHRACGNPPKNSEKLRKSFRISQLGATNSPRGSKTLWIQLISIIGSKIHESDLLPSIFGLACVLGKW